MSEFLKKLEIVFRHAVVYPLFRLLLHNKTNADPLELASIRKLLILRTDGIGDMLVSTPAFRYLKEAHPKLFLAVFASERNVAVIRFNPFVDKIYVRSGNWWNLAKEILDARREHYDVVVNFVFNRTTSEGLLANFVAPGGVKIGQGLDKYRLYFNRLLKLERSTMHMVEVLITMLNTVFITHAKTDHVHPEIFVDNSSRRIVDKFLQKNDLRRRSDPSGEKSPYVVTNFSAVDQIRRMSAEQVVAIVQWIVKTRKERPIIIYPPQDSSLAKSILRRLDTRHALLYPEDGSAGLLELASLIEGAACTITCDTSIVHFSSATRTPVFVLFTPTAAKNHEWIPFGVPYKALYAKLGDGVSSIPQSEILGELEEFLTQVENAAASHAKVSS